VKNRNVGRRITAQEREYFRKGIKMFYIFSPGNSLRSAFHKTLSRFFGVEDETRDGISRTILPALEDLPTFRQFYYLYNKEFASKLTTIQSELTRNQRNLLHSRQSIEANLLSNPHLDCNQNDLSQSLGESNSNQF